MVSGIKIQAFSGSYVYAGRDKGPVRKSRKDPSVKETSLVKKEGRGPGQHGRDSWQCADGSARSRSYITGGIYDIPP
jgi:hypothetical protein